MEPNHEVHPPEPSKKGSIGLPVVVNAALMLVLYGVVAASTGGRDGDTSFAYFLVLVALLAGNILAFFLALFIGSRQTVFGFLFSILVIFLIGLGTCAHSLQHMHVN